MTRSSTAAALLTALALAALPTAAHAAERGPARDDLGRQVLGERDGWAASGGGTTGGAAAADGAVAHVRTWTELRTALGGPGDAPRRLDTPRIVYVHGELDAWQAPDGARTDCATFERETGFRQADYIAAFDPAGPWGPRDPEGDLVTRQAAAAAAQARQTQQHVPSNTTIIGVGDGARIDGANLRIRDTHNVIVRNLTLSDATDCFPEWDPGDAGGNWNARYDTLSLWTARNVWADHLTLDSGDLPPSRLDRVYGRPYEVHDGLLDITHGSDLVTVSHTVFGEHDKTMLIGSSDSRTADRGLLRVTLHDNHWVHVGQRAPRVRYGQVHAYNNLYDVGTGFSYLWGVGVESALHAENNYVRLAPGTDPATVVADWGGAGMTEVGTVVDRRRTSLLATYNDAHPDDPLGTDAGWDPVLHERVLPAHAIRSRVERNAGAGNA